MLLFPRATSQSHAGMTLTTAARVEYPALLGCFKFDAPLLAARDLTVQNLEI